MITSILRVYDKHSRNNVVYKAKTVDSRSHYEDAYIENISRLLSLIRVLDTLDIIESSNNTETDTIYFYKMEEPR
jgi:hypothetical protein